MIRRRTVRLVSQYVAHYGPNYYGLSGWPVEAGPLDVPGTHAQMRQVLEAAEAGTVDAATTAQALRRAGDVAEFCLDRNRAELAAIDAEYGELFRTVRYVSGEAAMAYRRMITLRSIIRDNIPVVAGLRLLARRYERRAMRRRS